MADLLQSHGFVVRRHLTPETTTKQAIERAFADIAREVGPNDRLLIYMAGHGVTKKVGLKQENRGYFLPSDGNETNTFSMIAMTDLQDRYSLEISAKQILFVLDACYSGLAFTSMGNVEPERSLTTLRDIAIRSSQPARFIFSAGGAGEQSTQVNNLSSSFFSYYLRKALAGEADFNPVDGVITVDELRLWVKDKVITESARYGLVQRPNLERVRHDVIGDGEFIFLRRR
jgi:uncharacterized caspase-like protein